MKGFNYKKAVQALNFFAIKTGGEINKMKALKLIWLSDRLHLRKYARTILSDTYFALPYGPVASGTKDLIEGTDFLSEIEREYRNQYIIYTDKYNYKSINDFYSKVFSKSDIETMSIIFEKYGLIDEFTLSKISHFFPEWNKFEQQLASKSASRIEMDYKDFFLDCEKGYNSVFETNPDSLALAKDIFLENCELGAR
jgi:uncharacterized phage-associated protein